MSRKTIIAGNWKMNMNVQETSSFVNQIKDNLPSPNKIESIIASPTVDLSALVKATKGSNLIPAAENAAVEDKGAFTGQTSPKTLSEIGIKYCILGHSEVRKYLKETDKLINKKIKALFRNDIKPIICVGESLEQHKSKQTNDFIATQIEGALYNLKENQAKKIVIAYEPIWAIGTGNTATPDQAQEVCSHIRSTIAKLFNQNLAEGTRILYGGSVNPNNIKELMKKTDIDGGLVGGASLDPTSFLKLVNYNE